MIFADFITDASIGLVLILAMLWVPVALLMWIIGKIARLMGEDVDRAGGMKAHLKRKAPGVAGRLLKWWLFGRRR